MHTAPTVIGTILAFMVTSAVGSAAPQQGVPSHYWLNHCTGGDAFERGTCIGYVEGSHDMWIARRPICSAGATGDELADAVVRYYRDRPERLKTSAGLDRHPSWLVGEALEHAFPC